LKGRNAKMKRSEINAKIKEMERMAEKIGFKLPPFLSWTPEEWADKGHEYDEIRDNLLGWDVTDYGQGDYEHLGITLITLRNGNVHDKKYAKTYAEKLIRILETQVSPMHYHWSKMEDIINRGGGNLLVQVYNADMSDKRRQDRANDVEVNMDGRRFRVPAGTKVKVTPGESITLYPYEFHEITAEPGTGEVIFGEVSMCNDDKADNYFIEELGRFPSIEEDEPAYRLLCTEYPPAK
jgi:D-lyxose ketol-isomerase